MRDIWYERNQSQNSALSDLLVPVRLHQHENWTKLCPEIQSDCLSQLRNYRNDKNEIQELEEVHMDTTWGDTRVGVLYKESVC